VGLKDDLGHYGTHDVKRWSTLAVIEVWMGVYGLQLTADKAEAVMLTRKKACGDPSFFVCGRRLTMKRCVKYLGVYI